MQRAHARALRAAKILTEGELAGIEGALDALADEFGAPPCPESDAEDLHTWVEALLVELVGAAGRKIHTARSRNDQVATLLVMYCQGAGERLTAGLGGLIETCCRQAQAWSDLIFPLQTHCQFAAPGSVGAWAVRYATAFDRARRHVTLAAGEWRRACPLGSGAVAGSSIPIDRTIQARELGFEGPSLSALDSTTSRDECVQLLALLTPVALHLQSLAADVIGFAQTPLKWVRYPMAFGTGSSMMPNKANPDAMELLRGTCNEILAAHGHAVLLLKGLPSGYNRDLQCLKPIVHEAVERTLGLIEMTTAFLEALEFDGAALAKSLPQGEIDATLRMEEKVMQGMPLRDAHHAVAEELAEKGDSRATQVGGHGPPYGSDRYQTIGAASPAETRRVAIAILTSLGEKN